MKRALLSLALGMTFLAASSAQAQVTAFGRTHTPLGQAELSVGPGGALSISNIGGTGQDGVETELGFLDFFNLDDVVLQNPPEGAHLAFTSYGVVRGVSNHAISSMMLDEMAGIWWVTPPDFIDNGNGEYQYQVYAGDELVGTLPSGYFQIWGDIASIRVGDQRLQQQNNCGCGPGSICKWCDPLGNVIFSHTPPGGAYTLCGCGSGASFWKLKLDGLSTVEVTGSGSLVGDVVKIVPLDGPEVTYLQKFQVTYSGITSDTITDEAIGVFGVPHRALGNATLAAFVDDSGLPALGIDHIGGTGNDGVRIDTGGATSIAQEFTVPPMTSIPVGKSIEIHAVDFFDADAFVECLSEKTSATQVSMHVDFNPPPISGEDVDFFLNGALVGHVNNHDPAQPIVSDDFANAFFAAWSAGGCECSMTFTDAPAVVSIPGFSGLVDRISVTPAEGAGIIDITSLRSIRITGDVGQLTVTNLSLGYAPACVPCDANCDGSVNLFDIDPFVQQLSGTGVGCSPCAADTNSDGSANIFDIDHFVQCITG